MGGFVSFYDMLVATYTFNNKVEVYPSFMCLLCFSCKDVLVVTSLYYVLLKPNHYLSYGQDVSLFCLCDF